MDKISQSAEYTPKWFLATTISSNDLIQQSWDHAFAPIYKQIMSAIRPESGISPELQADLTKVFPLGENFWAEFGHEPTSLSFEQIYNGMQRLSASPKVMAMPEVAGGVKTFFAQYKMLQDALQRSQQAPQAEQKGPSSKKPAAKPAKQPSAKVKQLQQLLGVEQTGLWNKASNDAFLNWLKTNGWDKHISGDRFTGNIDDAIAAMLVEKASPQAEPAGEIGKLPKDARQKRLDALKKFARAERIENLKKLL